MNTASARGTHTIPSLFGRAGVYSNQRISTVLDVACGLSSKSQHIDADIRVGGVHRPFLGEIEASVP